MRFMIIVKATPDSEAGRFPPNPEPLFQAMAAYHEELARAGALLDASGLQPSSKGWRVQYEGGKRTIVDGPFTESKELIAGYTLIQTRTREEALEWSRRFPNPIGEGVNCHIEVRHELGIAVPIAVGQIEPHEIGDVACHGTRGLPAARQRQRAALLARGHFGIGRRACAEELLDLALDLLHGGPRSIRLHGSDGEERSLRLCVDNRRARAV